MRWISGIIFAVGLVCLVMFVPVLYIKFFVVFTAILAAREFLSLALRDESSLSKIFFVLLSALGTALFVFSSNPWHFFYYFYSVIFLSFVSQFTSKVEPVVKIHRVALFVLSTMYIAVLFGLAGKIADRPHYQFWFLLVFAATFLSDTFAYVGGKRFGKHKLAPQLSPAKTVEGVIAGFLGAVAASVVIRAIFWPGFDLVVVLILGFVIAVFAVLGDLSESLLKRGFNCKDSGKIIPGHGGVLDRLDALLFAAPLIYFISLFF